MTRKVWVSILIVALAALIVVPSISVWAAGDGTIEGVLEGPHKSMQELAIDVMQRGAPAFEPLFKQYNAALDFKQTHYMFNEGGNFIVTEVAKFPEKSTDKIIIGLVYVSGDELLKEMGLPAPGWYAIGTYPSKEKEWKGVFLNQYGKAVAGFVAMTTPDGTGHSLGVRCQACLHIHIPAWLFDVDWCMNLHFSWGYWAPCCH